MDRTSCCTAAEPPTSGEDTSALQPQSWILVSVVWVHVAWHVIFLYTVLNMLCNINRVACDTEDLCCVCGYSTTCSQHIEYPPKITKSILTDLFMVHSFLLYDVFNYELLFTS